MSSEVSRVVPDDAENKSEILGSSVPAKVSVKRTPVHAAVAARIGLRAEPGSLDWEKAGLRPEFPGLPEAKSQRSILIPISFVVLVVLPVLTTAIYFFCFAANQYVAEFRFSVTQVTPNIASMTGTSGVSQPGSTGSGSSLLSGIASSIGGMSGGLPGSPSMTDNYMVIDYIQSRQAVDELDNRIKLRSLYSTNISDFWARFDSRKPVEKFMDYWNNVVTTSYDPITGLATVSVRAFRPENALLIASTLVQLSETLVNHVEKRFQLDAITFAEAEADKANERLKSVRAQLRDFRLKKGVVDPAGIVGTNTDLAKGLRSTLLQLQANLATLSNQNVGPNSTAAISLRSQIAATQAQLAGLEREVSKDSEANSALVGLVDRSEELNVDLQYAESMAISTRQALDQARANASAQHLYLTPYVSPALPESSTYPNRIQSIAVVAISSFFLWMLIVLAARSFSERV